MTHYEDIPDPTPGQLAAELNRAIQHSGTVEGRSAALKTWAYYRVLPTIAALRELQARQDGTWDKALQEFEDPGSTDRKTIGEGG